MDLLFALIFSFTILIISVSQGYFILYALLASIFAFIIVYLKKGLKLKFLLQQAWFGSQKCLPVLVILLLIGATTAVWLAAGTVPALVYYGTKLVSPQYFVLTAFLFTSIVSILLGTSFGTVGTVGIALMMMARTSNLNSHLIAGAIIAGAYVGDRCSPMSSSAYLVASLTKTNIYTNLNKMVVTSVVPFVITCVIYFGVSLWQPVTINQTSLTEAITDFFTINSLVFLPAIAIVLLALLRWEIKLILLISIVLAVAIASQIQGYSTYEICQYIIYGYNLNSATPLSDILAGGGILPMAKVCLVVTASTALAGILSGTQTLNIIERLLTRIINKSSLLLETLIISLFTAAYGCTQTIAIVLTQQLIQKKYEQAQLTQTQLAVDLENTAVVLSPLIPWNIAGLIPATILMTDARFIPYAFYLYLLPLWNLLFRKS